MKAIIYKYTKAMMTAWVGLAALAFTGCLSDESDRVCPRTETVSMRVSLDVPGMNGVRSRSMSGTQEQTIDYGRVQVLVFEDTPSGEVFSYRATIEEVVGQTMTLKVPTSRAGEKYRFVVIANADPQTIAVGTPKNNALSQFQFACAGKWNASATTPDLIPMWGEFGETFVIDRERYINILLHRALARVDVGIRFKFNQPGDDQSDMEAVLGLDNFKIKEIRVYRTKALAYAATSADRMTGNEVTTPNIPAGAQFNTGSGTPTSNISTAEADPLAYILTAAGNGYIREIYIPESFAVDAQSTMDDVPCLVIGGYFGEGNTTVLTHYRADFATYNGTAVETYKPVLRNHRYVFDINRVSGPGFTNPEEALHGINSDMTLTVEDWNEVPLNYYVQGDYFLRVSTRDVLLEARAATAGVFPSESVVYQTNLALHAQNKPFTYTWTSGNTTSPYFDVAFDYALGKIVFTAKQNNIASGAQMLSDVLTLRVENFELTIRVRQKASDTAFEIDCASVEVHGKYREGVPLNYTNYISLKIVSQDRLIDEEYEVRTIEVNGIYFLASGTMTSTDGSPIGTGWEYELQLTGYGTPVNETGEDPFRSFNVTIVSSSTLPGSCSARIIIGYQTKKILAIGANASYRYGYVLEPNTASRAFMDANVNFGTNLNSTVTMETNASGYAFTIEYMTHGQGMSSEVINYDYLLNKLNTFKPDIILTGQAINFMPGVPTPDMRTINLLTSFVNAGGVMLMFNEYYPNASSIEAMVRSVMDGNSAITGSHIVVTSGGLTYPLSGNAGADDPVTNGPFGNVYGNLWGSDGFYLYGFTGLPDSEVITYSTRNPNTLFFRHKTKPFVFIGDGGFISNAQRYIGGAYQGSYDYCPFAIDASYRPIPRTNYTSDRVSVYNSVIFGNIVAWAVDQAETSGIRYPETGNKFPITP